MITVCPRFTEKAQRIEAKKLKLQKCQEEKYAKLELEPTTIADGAPRKDLVGKFIKFIAVPVNCYSLSQLFVSYRNMDNPKYIYGLVFNLETVPRWKLFPFAIFECYVSFSAGSIMLFYIMLVIVYLKSTKWCLGELMYEQLKNLPFFAALITPYAFILFFRVMASRNKVLKSLRAIQLLNHHFNNTFRNITMPACILTTLVLIIVSNYATVKWFREVKTFTLVCVAMTCVALEVWPTSSQVNEESVHILRYLLRGNSNNCINTRGKIQSRVAVRKAYLWKMVKSTRPLSVDIGSYFSIKRITTATYISVAIDVTFQLLILY